ncbi:hypothetical protein BDW69DRAFT_203903 [Aspergillus filifer]
MQRAAVVLAIGCAQIAVRVCGLLPGLLILTTAVALSIPIWLLYVCFSCRPFTPSATKDGSSQRMSLGQPLLLPTQVSHTRLGPGHYNYTVPHFLIGVPIGLRGRLGGLLSIDEPNRCRLDPEASSPSRTQSPGLWQYGIPSPKFGRQSWFTVHAHHHLEKGVGGGLEGKMRHYLASQGENPDDYPHAYLLTMPQFLGYQRNLVCLWYLYNANRELSALITEVNNYWGQRKIAFCKLEGEGESAVLPCPPKAEKEKVGAESRSIYSNSTSKYATYRGTWNKDMFISPFEKVGGAISLRVSDPLAPIFNGSPNPLQVTITLLSNIGKPTLIGRIFTPEDEDKGHKPLDPVTVSSWSLFRFLPYWTAVLVITELMIIVSALWIKSQGVKMYTAPEVNRRNFPREETKVERDLEGAFRAYLRHLVTSNPWPGNRNVKIEYIPSKSHHLQRETFSSPCDVEHPYPLTTITIQPLTPSFYTSFPAYRDALTAFKEESRFKSVDADPHSRRLYISHPELFFSLIKACASVTRTTSPFQNLSEDQKPNPSLCRRIRILSPLCQSRAEGGSFLDTFVEKFLSPRKQKTYFTARVKHRVSEKVALGSHGLLDLYRSLLSCLGFRLFVGNPATALTAAAALAMICHLGVLKFASWIVGLV